MLGCEVIANSVSVENEFMKCVVSCVCQLGLQYVCIEIGNVKRKRKEMRNKSRWNLKIELKTEPAY